ncbi:MAG TPA: tetratricopeptide repeat protein [Stellaceae bacterium]|nr:tetratricopeptide repeat protein [Stellaceae bacterium]
MADDEPRAGPEPATETPPEQSPEQRLAGLLNLAGDHERAGRLNEAEALLNRIREEAPDHPAAIHQLGIVAFRRGQPGRAAELMERSVELAPHSALFHRNLCEAYRTLDRYDDALAVGLRAVALDPNDILCRHNLSVLRYDRLELDEAIASAEAALQLEPNFPGAHFGIAEATLLRGEFARGWEEYEWRFRLAGVQPLMPPTEKPQWDGRKLRDGARLLLIADQGYGDVIQFSRFIPWAAERAPQIAIACSAELRPVVGQYAGGATMFDHWDSAPEFAAYSALSSLPRLAGTRPESIPQATPPLRADAAKRAAWAARLDALSPAGYRRIGIVWAGRPTHRNDRRRSIGLEQLGPLTMLPGVTLVALQKGASQAQIGGYWRHAPLLNLGPEIRDYADTMAILESLERVVAVDTSVAHLAGAMGKPVSIMLPYAPDWRWGLKGETTPWYPTARLFRQDVRRDWSTVIAQVAESIRDPIAPT